jgi:hypothetical protein
MGQKNFRAAVKFASFSCSSFVKIAGNVAKPGATAIPNENGNNRDSTKCHRHSFTDAAAVGARMTAVRTT